MKTGRVAIMSRNKEKDEIAARGGDTEARDTAEDNMVPSRPYTGGRESISGLFRACFLRILRTCRCMQELS
ncbi:hypothetical protein E2C01_085578 [Portunus trituberculatus]|uniref:Uncharacterized protein n=1 Tax=Portunus trituberculatus TaxID=210409 RepID=A0A5B7J7Z1_PORTR|nr:hypothetical protein [Portunus trituberculatus]